MNLTTYIIPAEHSLRDALKKLNTLSGGSMTLFVTDGDSIIGTLTDGDIRRALISGASLNDQAGSAAFSAFKYITTTNPDVKTLKDLRARGITMVPVIDANHHLVDIIDLSITHTRLPLSAILMAGGKGERLRPLTLSTPKPLLEIDGKPIIDYNIEALASCGINDITVTVNYLAEKIEEHFSSPVAGVPVKTVRETMPLGTIGSAALINHRPGASSIVMNSDLLTTISFEDMYLRHRDLEADITIAVIPYQVSVPFAILDIDGHNVKGIQEKPSYSYYANAGIYIFNNDLLASLPTDRRTDATDLIEQAIDSGKRVVYFPINGSWIDVGSPTDFRQAAELMKHYRNFSANH